MIVASEEIWERMKNLEGLVANLSAENKRLKVAIEENLQHHREYVAHILPVVRAAETYVDVVHNINNGPTEITMSFGYLDREVKRMRGVS